jgi:hypothetical protein
MDESSQSTCGGACLTRRGKVEAASMRVRDAPLHISVSLAVCCETVSTPVLGTKNFLKNLWRKGERGREEEAWCGLIPWATVDFASEKIEYLVAPVRLLG